jgi:hypothetical protein
MPSCQSVICLGPGPTQLARSQVTGTGTDSQLTTAPVLHYYRYYKQWQQWFGKLVCENLKGEEIPVPVPVVEF